MNNDPTKWAGNNKIRTDHSSLSKYVGWIHFPRRTNQEKKPEKQIDEVFDPNLDNSQLNPNLRDIADEHIINAKDNPDQIPTDWTSDEKLIHPTMMDNENDSDIEKNNKSKKHKTPGVG